VPGTPAAAAAASGHTPEADPAAAAQGASAYYGVLVAYGALAKWLENHAAAGRALQILLGTSSIVDISTHI
jgi:hypothetical protein